MWAHEAIEALKKGKKVRRGSWPEGDHVQALPETIDMSDLDPKSFGVDAKFDVQIAEGSLAYCSAKGKTASIGYELTGEDKNSQDWSEVK